MVPAPVRHAARKLAPLLERPGLSPPVDKALRGAAARLDAVLATSAMEAQLAMLYAAVAELEACVALIKASPNAADQGVLEGAARVLRSLHRLVSPADGRPSARGRAPLPQTMTIPPEGRGGARDAPAGGREATAAGGRHGGRARAPPRGATARRQPGSAGGTR